MSGYNYTYQCVDFGSSPSSSPLKATMTNKRAFEDEYSSPSTVKKLQAHKIHSQVHMSTIEMMMNASRLPQNEPLAMASEDDTPKEPQAPFQKPYWPEINRLKS